MSKRVQKKIKEKHNNVSEFTQFIQFSTLINSVIASVGYKKDKPIINFISYIESKNKFILFSLKKEKHHTSCSTIFSLRAETLKKYYKEDSFRLLDKNSKEIIKRYITD